MPDPTLGDYTAVAGAVFTAVAAGAAAVAARQGRAALDAAERPHLEIQVLADASTALLGLSIINTGRGVAQGVNFAVNALGQLTDSVVSDGFLQAGERVHVLTDIGPLPTPPRQLRGDISDLGAMVVWRDGAGFAHYRSHEGRQITPRTRLLRRPKYPDRVEMFKELFPHIDPDAAERKGNVLKAPPPP